MELTLATVAALDTRIVSRLGTVYSLVWTVTVAAFDIRLILAVDGLVSGFCCQLEISMSSQVQHTLVAATAFDLLFIGAIGCLVSNFTISA
jgi:hypothetical protein